MRNPIELRELILSKLDGGCLDLRQQGLTNNDCQSVVDILRNEHIILRFLNVSQNCIGDVGAGILAQIPLRSS